ncbi:MAG: imidazole glycerol phosphate synthase subunit HisH [Xanthobacteraceae bacterium]
MPNVAVVDYGMGNLRSVMNALGELSVAAELITEPASVDRFERLLLPGVGAFAQAIATLRKSGMADALDRFVSSGRPVLGICLGMQLMCSMSEEDGMHEGLGWVPARVVSFPRSRGLKIPHMGWNALHLERSDPLFDGIDEASDVYFVHSYYVACERAADVLASTEHGVAFASIMGRKNLYGMQFHPEKSQSIGLRLLANFLRLPSQC